MRRLATNPLLLWAVFLAIHVWLAYIGLTAATIPWGDVTTVYNGWIQHAFNGYWVGIDGPWVYPLLALVPMLAASVLGSNLYGIGWFLLVLLVDALVFAFILNSRTTALAVTADTADAEALAVSTGPGLMADTGSSAVIVPTTRPTPDARSRDFGNGLRFVAAWWWVAFLLLLGPVSLGRIDTFTVALVTVGLLFVIRRPVVAGLLLALATWVKVWPVALVVALIIAARKRITIAAAAGVTAVGVAIVGLFLGAGMNLFSFVTQQTSRGLQVEAPVSTPWMWMAYFQLPGSRVYYDHDILTFQVKGTGATVADFLTTPLLAVAVLAMLLVGVYVVRTGASVQRVLPNLALALVTALIIFNKVGSPQFMLWLSAPIILGIIWQGRQFAVFAVIASLLAALTQIIYPYLYDWLLSLDPLMLLALTARNALEVVLFALALRALWRSRHHAAHPVIVPAQKVAI